MLSVWETISTPYSSTISPVSKSKRMTAYENKRKQGDTDMAEKNLIKVYVNDISQSKRVNLIIKTIMILWELWKDIRKDSGT